LKRRVLLGSALAIVLSVPAAGCGGDEPLTKEEYVSRLNAICQDFSEREKEIGEPQSLGDLTERGPRVRDAFEKTVLEKVRNLKAPDEIADQADRLREIAQRQRDVLGGLIEAAKSNDFPKVRELMAKNEALNNEANSIALDLGAEACSGA
jgi:hypothetical protein